MTFFTQKKAKAWLRQLYQHKRKRFSLSKRKSLSQKITRRVSRASFLKKSKTMAVFIGFGSEIDTRPLIKMAWKKKKTVLIPYTSRGIKNYTFVAYNPKDKLVRKPYGPLELKNKKPSFSYGKIDLILVPGLAFDRKRTRLGYGGGVYDRLLKKCAKALSVGLFYSFQESQGLPRSRHDYSLDRILTENGAL